MRTKLYNLLIKPRQEDSELQSRELVLNVLYIGTLSVFALAAVVIFANYLSGYHYLIPRLESVVLAWVLIALMYWLSRAGHYRAAAWFLILLYLSLGIGVAWQWGVTFPPAVMLFGLVIMVTGTVLGSPSPPYAAGLVVVSVITLQIFESNGTISPDLGWAKDPIDLGIVVGLCLVFIVIALISWLFNEQTENSLHRAHRAEAGLLRQKMLLESKVEERTRQLQAEQFEKVQQLYRFAELGQLSTALLHDLANHLTTLTLDIEGLQEQNSSHILRRAKRSIRYIDDMVLRVRDQLQGKQSVKHFNAASEIEEVVRILSHKAREAGVTLKWDTTEDRKQLRCSGEPIRFRQVMANLISNAIDSYPAIGDEKTPKQLREVVITAESKRTDVIINVIDQGKGIPADDREKIFTPFYSTKKTGMGLGLFISKQIIEDYFAGTITLRATDSQTTFTVSVAKV